MLCFCLNTRVVVFKSTFLKERKLKMYGGRTWLRSNIYTGLNFALIQHSLFLLLQGKSAVDITWHVLQFLVGGWFGAQCIAGGCLNSDHVNSVGLLGLIKKNKKETFCCVIFCCLCCCYGALKKKKKNLKNVACKVDVQLPFFLVSGLRFAQYLFLVIAALC